MKKEKIFTIGMIILIVVLIIMVFFVGGNSKETGSSSNTLSEDSKIIMANAQKESEEAKKSKQKELNEINVSDYKRMLEGEKLSIILVARPTCYYCQMAEPIIKSLLYEYDFDLDYLNTDNFNEDDEAEFIKSNEYFAEGFGTPLLLAVSNNEIVDKIEGLTDKAHFIEFFRTYKYIE